MEASMEKSTSETQIATFQVDKEMFGIGIHRIKEIVRYPEITHVPRSVGYLKGLTNLRGNVLPVIDARVRLNLPISEVSDRTRVLVLDVHDSLVGVIVDNVRGVASLENVRVEPPPPILSSGIDSRFIRNVIHSNTDSQITMELNVETLCDIENTRSSEEGSSVKFQNVSTESNASKALVNERQLVTFLIGMEEYGFSIQTVEEILRVSKITEVPDAPSYVLGLLSLRNKLLPIIDLRKLFKMSSLVDNKIQEIEKHINSYRTWLSNFEFSLKNDTNQFKPIDSLKAMKWIESFRTSSENIGKILQTVKFTHQELSYQSGNIFELKNEQSAESIQELFDTRITPSFNRLITKLEECKEALLVELKEDQRILVIDLNNQSIGIMVDRMQQVIRVPENLIDPPPGIIHGDKKDNLQGIVKLDSGNRLILLIDELRLFSEDIMNSLKKMDSVNTTNEEEKVVGEENLDRDEGQLVTFRLGKEEFGIFIEDVREINRLSGITAVPNAPSFVEGIMNLRGNVIPAVDLRKRFGLESIQHGESTRVIIVDIEDKTTGLIVDSVSDVIRISRSLIESPPEVISSKVETEFIQGIGNLVKQNRFIIILNVNKILSGSEKEQLSSVSSEM